MGSANLLSIRGKIESTYKVAPSLSSGVLELVQKKSQSIIPATRYQTSDVLRSDRQTTEDVLIGFDVPGEIPMALTYSDVGSLYRALVIAMIQDTTGTTAITQQASCTTSTSGGAVITKAAAWGTYKVGDIVRVSGGTSGGDQDNKFYRINAIATNTITVDKVGNWATAETTITVTGGVRLRNGTTQRTYTLEIANPDVNVYRLITGLGVNTANLSIADEQLTTLVLGFLGATMSVASSPYSSGVTPDVSYGEVSSKSHVPLIQIDGSIIGVKSLTANHNNNMRNNTQVGSLQAIELISGSLTVGGEIEMYLTSTTQLAMLLADAKHELSFVTKDASNFAMAWSYPAIKLTAADVSTQGINTDQRQRLKWAAGLPVAGGSQPDSFMWQLQYIPNT